MPSIEEQREGFAKEFRNFVGIADHSPVDVEKLLDRFCELRPDISYEILPDKMLPRVHARYVSAKRLIEISASTYAALQRKAAVASSLQKKFCTLG